MIRQPAGASQAPPPATPADKIICPSARQTYHAIWQHAAILQLAALRNCNAKGQSLPDNPIAPAPHLLQLAPSGDKTCLSGKLFATGRTSLTGISVFFCPFFLTGIFGTTDTPTDGLDPPRPAAVFTRSYP
jgi:hypothetical protein